MDVDAWGGGLGYDLTLKGVPVGVGVDGAVGGDCGDASRWGLAMRKHPVEARGGVTLYASGLVRPAFHRFVLHIVAQCFKLIDKVFRNGSNVGIHDFVSQSHYVVHRRFRHIFSHHADR